MFKAIKLELLAVVAAMLKRKKGPLFNSQD